MVLYVKLLEPDMKYLRSNTLSYYSFLDILYINNIYIVFIYMDLSLLIINSSICSSLSNVKFPSLFRYTPDRTFLHKLNKYPTWLYLRSYPLFSITSLVIFF